MRRTILVLKWCKVKFGRSSTKRYIKREISLPKEKNETRR
jgi:hypothetical protein